MATPNVHSNFDNVISLANAQARRRNVSAESHGVINDCRDIALKRITEVLSKSFDTIEDELFEMAQLSADLLEGAQLGAQLHVSVGGGSVPGGLADWWPFQPGEGSREKGATKAQHEPPGWPLSKDHRAAGRNKEGNRRRF